MVLGISEIQKLIKDKKLIENLSDREKNEPEGAVIDLRLDKLFKLAGKGFIGITERKTPDVKEICAYDKKTPKKYTIKPQEYYLAKTVEVIHLPENLVALFVPRSSLFRSGLILSSGNTNPGFVGPLYFGLYNASSCEFEFEMGARFCSIYFMEIKGKVKNLYRGQWQGGRDTAKTLEKQI
jgi:deoxycytidine triphosphate deaminase